ncbi:MFS transporter [Pseudomonas mosselii]|uniref:MFS transporter n=1 Tax=Pseudomonas mosselii TaxID=78327 RepID=UPI00244B9361|nr:MFS transporter [Pseudomonas mosselii]MDH1102094.1 MFS transporter [Pseudomonas mosselii]MEB5933987.1 MFS transporter [Pseudomonas mosselii]
MTKRRILYFSCLAVLLCQSGITFYLPMLPAIADDLNATDEFAALSLSLFLGAMGACVMLWGRLGATLGSSRMLTWTLLLYGCCTFLLAVSPVAWAFLVLRLLQGALAGGISVAARALLVEQYDGKDLTRAYSSLSLCFVLSLGASQFIGAMIATLTNWRIAMLLVAMPCVLMATLKGWNIAAQHIVLPHRTGESARFHKLIVQPRFILPVLVGGFGYSIIVVFSSTAPVLLQQSFNWSMWEYGLLGWPISIAYLLGTRLASALATGHNEVRMLRFSGALLLLGALIMLIASSLLKNSAYAIWLPYCLMLVAQGMAYPVSLSLASRQSTGAASPAMALIALVHQLLAALTNLISSSMGTSPTVLVIICAGLASLAWLATRPSTSN